MIASLPMYDRPETATANDRLWVLIRAALADRGIAAPETLSRDLDPWDLWRRPDLVLAQTCGLPYRTQLHGNVELVGTPVYDLPCDPGHYFSVLVAHRNDTRDPAAFDDAVLAVNDGQSQSGWAAPLDWAERNGIRFGKPLITGAHRASGRAVAEGRADIAALDALSWKMIQRWDSFARDLREVAQTRPTPTLPFIAAKGANAAQTGLAIAEAIGALSPEDRGVLCLDGIAQIPAKAYLAVTTPAPPGD